MTGRDTRFGCSVDRSGSDRTLVRVVGELDIATAPELTEVLRTATAEGGFVIVDMSAVTFMDCMGLAVIVAACKRSLRGQRGFLVRSASLQVTRLLELTGMLELLQTAALPPAGMITAGSRAGLRASHAAGRSRPEAAVSSS